MYRYERNHHHKHVEMGVKSQFLLCSTYHCELAFTVKMSKFVGASSFGSHNLLKSHQRWIDRTTFLPSLSTSECCVSCSQQYVVISWWIWVRRYIKKMTTYICIQHYLWYILSMRCSDPAKSTRVSTPSFKLPVAGLIELGNMMYILRIACDRDEVSFTPVAAVVRTLHPKSMN